MTQPSSSAHKPETHARHTLEDGAPYSLDSVLHLSRYSWVADHVVQDGDTVVDLGCGTGFGVVIMSGKCAEVVGIDFDPEVVELTRTLDLENASFLCADVCSPGLADRVGVHDANVVVSMETIEHLVDYFAYVRNAVEMLADRGVFVVGTPNRMMTYERYTDRRHMDPSHVQEFTSVSLETTLRTYFESVELYFQFIPAHWATSGHDEEPQLDSPTRFGPSRGWIPPNLLPMAQRIHTRLLHGKGLAVIDTERRFDVDDVQIQLASDVPTVSLDAFALIAVCRTPRR